MPGRAFDGIAKFDGSPTRQQPTQKVSRVQPPDNIFSRKTPPDKVTLAMPRREWMEGSGGSDWLRLDVTPSPAKEGAVT